MSNSVHRKRDLTTYIVMKDAIETEGTSAVAIVSDQTGRQLHFFHVSTLYTVGPLFIESPGAKKQKSTGSLQAQNPSVVQMKFEKNR